MLRPEEARERLEAQRIPKWVKRKRMGIRLLKPRAHRLIRRLFEDAALNDDIYQHVDDDLARHLGHELCGLGSKGRRHLFRALFPKLVDVLEGAYLAFSRLPYTTGYARRPFRAPNRPGAYVVRTGKWFGEVFLALRGYDPDSKWVASWAAHLHGVSADLGWLLAAAIDEGGADGVQVYETLVACLHGEHETGDMGRHVIGALLGCEQPRAWDLVGRTLLAAQRQEGLRQTILEAIDEAHPGAYLKLMGLVLDENLIRFASTVRAADVWLGYGWDTATAKTMRAVLERILPLLEDPSRRAMAVRSEDAETCYLGLWAEAFHDVERALPSAQALLSHPRAEHRYVAARFLVSTQLVESEVSLASALLDEDLRVARVATELLSAPSDWALETVDDLFERFQGLFERLPKRKTALEPLVWPWTGVSFARADLADALTATLGSRSTARLIPYLASFEPWKRRTTLCRLAHVLAPYEKLKPALRREQRNPLSPAVRSLCLGLLGDPSSDVKAVAFEALGRYAIQQDEVERIEELLKRKAAILRTAGLQRLLTQGGDGPLRSAERLLTSSQKMQRQAGAELLRRLAEDGGRLAGRARNRIATHAAEAPELFAGLGAEAVVGDAVITMDDALGLLPAPVERRVQKPKAVRHVGWTPAAERCLKALDALVGEHKDVEVVIEDRWDGQRVELLGNMVWGFPEPKADLSLEEDRARLILHDVWLGWFATRPATLRDDDGLEFVRAMRPRGSNDPAHLQGLGYTWQTRALLQWFLRLDPPEGAADHVLDALQNLLCKRSKGDEIEDALHRARAIRRCLAGSWTGAHDSRFLRIMREYQSRLDWTDLAELEDVTRAYVAGGATIEVFIEYLVIRRGKTLVELRNEDSEYSVWSGGRSYHDLNKSSGRRPAKEIREHPELLAAVARLRERMVEVECARGDLPTAASSAITSLSWTGGMDALLRAVAAMGLENWARQDAWLNEATRKQALSHIVSRTVPGDGDTPEEFAARVADMKRREKRLIGVAVYAPRWGAHVEEALGWPGLSDSVWWLHAHTKESDWGRRRTLKEIWEVEVGTRTDLSGEDLFDGAVDVDWFRTCYGALGAERWALLLKAAKFASSAGGHKRAELFSRSMTAMVSEHELATRITEKRHQDVVRALGLLPLPEDGSRDAVLFARYERIQTFKRESRRFGSQRQASEGRAAEIGLRNLARTAGFRDPLRMQWALETDAVADLAAGPVVLAFEETTLALSIQTDGTPQLEILKKGRRLKGVPAKLRKEESVKALRARLNALKKSRSLMRGSLEEAMCRGDTFTGTELRGIFRHPVLAPQLERLVFTGSAGTGYAASEGRELVDHAGTSRPVPADATLRIAHPHDLYADGAWSAWQSECFASERVQPFKQVFRELYPITQAECTESMESRRYAGHQVNPKQALALFKARRWVASPDEGLIKTFHDAGITAVVWADAPLYTPAEVDGLTLESVTFVRHGDVSGRVALDCVPPVIFSEVMRDLDLVVSVAHRGGVDPEATASTVEMRATLVRETCALMNIENVTLKAHHALIEGRRATYSLHLGSAMIHRVPGGHLCIIPVHAQIRGRLFLPFADDDPKTAEVMSKVLLLARDDKIKDPTILEQIR